MKKSNSKTATRKTRRGSASNASASRPANGKALPATSSDSAESSKSGDLKKTDLRLIAAKKLVTLKRNPQYLTPKQMESLKASIRRDGFCAPILVRPYKAGRFEVISGNHRFMAAVEIGLLEIPCVVSDMSDGAAKRLAINLNTIHGEPNAELLAPFLAELESDFLKDIHIEDILKESLMKYDDTLAELLAKLEAPDAVNRDSPKQSNETCVCAKCGATHFKPKE